MFMVKGKYGLSPEGVNKLMDRLTSIVTSGTDNSKVQTDMLGAKISSSFVKKLTKVQDEADVIERNEQLTKHFKGLLSMYGFDTMYDMYIYSLSCDPVGSEVSKSKDYSRLVPVKRRVTRNGKEHEVTIWVKPSDEDDTDDNGDGNGVRRRGRNNKDNRRRRNARELTTEGAKSSKDYTLENLARLKKEVKDFPRGNKPFQDGSSYYLEIRDDNGDIVGVVGYKENEGYISMDFYRSNGRVPGVASKGFFELLKLSAKEGKGVRMDDVKEARQLFLSSGLEQKDSGVWEISYEDLTKILSFGGNEGSKSNVDV